MAVHSIKLPNGNFVKIEHCSPEMKKLAQKSDGILNLTPDEVATVEEMSKVIINELKASAAYLDEITAGRQPQCIETRSQYRRIGDDSYKESKELVMSCNPDPTLVPSSTSDQLKLSCAMAFAQTASEYLEALKSFAKRHNVKLNSVQIGNQKHDLKREAAELIDKLNHTYCDVSSQHSDLLGWPKVVDAIPEPGRRRVGK